jgi:hypothetical protein
MTALNKQISGTHYKDMPIQPIEFITKNKLDWYQGNIVKYASRHHSKGGADDLRKVIHYAELALEAQYGQPAADAPETITVHACDDAWIEWNGGECPVGPDVMVEAVSRGGYQFTRRAGDVWWNHLDVLSDIIKYRVVKQATPDDGWIEWAGGECPVAPGVVVEVVTSGNGGGKCEAHTLDWGHVKSSKYNIIKYRVAK